MVSLKQFYKHALICLVSLSIVIGQNNKLVGEEAPTFYLLDINNKDFFLSQSIEKPILINFFATWCIPCIEELPDLRSFDQKHANKVKVILIDESNMAALPEQKTSKDELIKFIKKENIQFDVLLDKYGIVAKSYQVASMISNKTNTTQSLVAVLPATFLINQKGIILWEKRGKVTAQDLRKLEEEFSEIFN